jgi:hypothetical protein
MSKPHEAGEAPAVTCPHCGGPDVHHYKDARLRRRVVKLRDDFVVLDGSVPTVFQRETAELACDECGRRIEPFGAQALAVDSAVFAFDGDLLLRNFVAARGKDHSQPLAKLPGGDVKSFGEFCSEVVALALGEWEAIIAPRGCGLRLLPLFPFGEELLPLVKVPGSEVELAGRPISRVEVENATEVGLAVETVDAAGAICLFAMDAANEILSEPFATVEPEDWA